MPSYRKKTKAFTLIEMLVAMSILTLVALMANNVLSTMLSSFQHHKMSQSGFKELQLAFLLIERDLLHSIAMPHKKLNPNDDTYMTFDKSDNASALWFMRSGWHTESQPESTNHLKRIGLKLVNGNLNRMIEEIESDLNIEQPILTNVQSIQYRFLDQSLAWHTSWPATGNHRQTLPKAIEIVLSIRDKGSVRRLIELSSNEYEQTL